MNVLGVTGHRPKSLGLPNFNPRHPVWQDAARAVKSRLWSFDSLISGGALGFDQVAAKVAVDMNIPFELALPFEGFDAWNDKDKARLQWLIERAAKVTYVCEPGYAPWKYQRRNEYIVDNSTEILALWNGAKGGTGNCVAYAVKQGLAYHAQKPLDLAVLM